jgi:hypothetical protein
MCLCNRSVRGLKQIEEQLEPLLRRKRQLQEILKEDKTNEYLDALANLQQQHRNLTMWRERLEQVANYNPSEYKNDIQKKVEALRKKQENVFTAIKANPNLLNIQRFIKLIAPVVVENPFFDISMLYAQVK